ncbi:hypothetical protein ALC62_04961 [Cyphomyrmex costatus]|uniref:Uncharacterized protein n=1 Tax=Cyphomyrmex costatus TaxID=456900 RepID=A0A195CU25_9HYME|nr:hypothetical protein ALC62_04961 [Cyphomyrmex costatus]
MGLERDGQRTRAGILADVNDSRRDNVEPFHHRRIRLLDCFARYEPGHCVHRDAAAELPQPRTSYEHMIKLVLISFYVDLTRKDV